MASKSCATSRRALTSSSRTSRRESSGASGSATRTCSRRNPRLVYVSLSAFGQTGPNAHYIGYGMQLYAASGASYTTEADGETLSQMWIPYPDPVSGLAGAFAIAAYVYNARVSGRPAFVDLSEMESLCGIMLEPLLLAAQSDSAMTPAGSDEAGYTVVRTADNHFVALMAREEAERRAAGRALDAADGTAGALRTAAQRFDADEVVHRMGKAGLFAVAVQDSSQCLQDPLLNERGFWVRDESPGLLDGNVRIGGAIWQIDGQRARIWRGAPPLFSDTRAVLERTLDYETGRVVDLFARGVVE